MEIKVTKSNFLKAAGLVTGVTAQKANTLPILGNVLLETTSKGELRLIGTDLEVGISTTLPVEVMKEGSITVPAKKSVRLCVSCLKGMWKSRFLKITP